MTEGIGLSKFLLHDYRSQCFTLITLTSVENLVEAWQSQLHTLKQLITHLKTVWTEIRYESEFHCSHCLLARFPSPHTTVDPNFFKDYVLHDSELEQRTYDGGDVSSCINDPQLDGLESVPTPLLRPCKYSNVTITIAY